MWCISFIVIFVRKAESFRKQHATKMKNIILKLAKIEDNKIYAIKFVCVFPGVTELKFRKPH